MNSLLCRIIDYCNLLECFLFIEILAKSPLLYFSKFTNVLPHFFEKFLGLFILIDDVGIPDELNIIKKYRVLDEHGKNAVNAILDIEYERIKAQGKKHKIRLLKIDYYSHAASAGTGNFLEKEKPEELWVHDTPEAERADFVISISGNSMEPTYHDGDKVFVEKHNILEVGDIGIFIVNGDAYIKELGDKCCCRTINRINRSLLELTTAYTAAERF